MIDALLHLIYPALCMHCKELLVSRQKFLCAHCTEHLTLVDPQRRCIKCFSEYDGFSRICKRCRQAKEPYTRLAACFESIGPALSLQKEFQNRLLLDQTLASWMIVQWARLGWPQPDLIVPFPQTLPERFLSGYHRPLLLAQRMGEALKVPVKNVFKKKAPFSDQVILLIDETLHPKEALHDCCTVLQEGFPKGIYVLAFSFQDYGVPSGSAV